MSSLLPASQLQQIKRNYDELGFAVVRRFCNESDLDECQQQARRYLSDIAPSKPDSEAFYLSREQPDSIVQAHEMYEAPYFRDLPWSERWLGLARCCAGTDACIPKGIANRRCGLQVRKYDCIYIADNNM